jgi:hypothetical protein
MILPCGDFLGCAASNNGTGITKLFLPTLDCWASIRQLTSLKVLLRPRQGKIVSEGKGGLSRTSRIEGCFQVLHNPGIRDAPLGAPAVLVASHITAIEFTICKAIVFFALSSLYYPLQPTQQPSAMPQHKVSSSPLMPTSPVSLSTGARLVRVPSRIPFMIYKPFLEYMMSLSTAICSA